MLAEVFLCLTLLFAIVYTVHYYAVYVRRYPRGPLPLPLIGNLHQLPSTDLHLHFDELHKRHGSVYTVFIPTAHVVLADYASIREALITKSEHFTEKLKHDRVLAMLSMIPNGGILKANGESWWEQRRATIAIMKQFGMAQSAVMEQKVLASVEELIVHLDSLPSHRLAQIDLFEPLQLCVGNVMTQLIFGYSFPHNSADEFFRFINILVSFFQSIMGREMLYYGGWPWLMRVPWLNASYKKARHDMEAYFNFIRAEVDRQVGQIDSEVSLVGSTTFVEAYLAKAAEENNPHLSIDQLYCVVSDFWVAGMETVSILLRWSMLYLTRYPDIQARARAEIDAVVGRDRPPTMLDRPLMPYFTALIAQIMRHSNTISLLFRDADSDQRISGHVIPNGTPVFVQLYSAVMHDDEFFDAPEEFRPERFLDTSADGLVLRRDAINRMLTFGCAKRRCPGEAMGQMELFLILATLLQRYEFYPPEGTKATEVDLTAVYGEVLYPKRQQCRMIAR